MYSTQNTSSSNGLATIYLLFKHRNYDANDAKPEDDPKSRYVDYL